MNLFCFLVSLTICAASNLKFGTFSNVNVVVKHLRANASRTIWIDLADSLSTHVSNQARHITIKNQNIPKLEAGAVANFPHLENLVLVNNQIRTIYKGAFKNLPHMKKLNLSHNEIEEVPFGIFNQLHLEELWLDHNKIAKIGYKGLSSMNLKKLFLNNNELTRWSKDWVAGSLILTLDLSWNKILELPPNAFQFMVQPSNGNVSLILTGNQIQKLGNNVFKGLKKLQRLYLDSNAIDWLGIEVFSGVESIIELNFNNNSLTNLDSHIFDNMELQILMLEDNKIRCLSTNLFKMEELDIDGNPITCYCVNLWLKWRDHYSNPDIYHITNLEQECL